MIDVTWRLASGKSSCRCGKLDPGELLQFLNFGVRLFFFFGKRCRMETCSWQNQPQLWQFWFRRFAPLLTLWGGTSILSWDRDTVGETGQRCGSLGSGGLSQNRESAREKCRRCDFSQFSSPCYFACCRVNFRRWITIFRNTYLLLEVVRQTIRLESLTIGLVFLTTSSSSSDTEIIFDSLDGKNNFKISDN